VAGGQGVSDLAARVDELAERWRLPKGSAGRLTALLELVVHDPHAPTTVRDPLHALDNHLADSLVALELEAVRRAGEIADLGAGAGFPGLPLAIALPQASVSLVESNRRKCDFLRRAVAVTGVANVTLVNTRTEQWSEGLGKHDLVTARALAPLPVVAEYAAPLLRIGGALVAWRGRRDPTQEALAITAASELGLAVAEPYRVRPYPSAHHRYLHLMHKVSRTPNRFPRRAGTALKRPLPSAAGASKRAPGPAGLGRAARGS
jgi:16S rRNA (guanine527-N7)-methyltransferase